MSLKIIVAIEQNNGIGYLNDLPWDNIIEDMSQFMYNTLNNTLILGRITWDSLDRTPLPGRTMVVVSRKKIKMPKGHYWYKDPYTAFQKHPNSWVIGGSSIYSAALSSGEVKEMLVSHVKGEYLSDRHFYFDLKDWKVVETEQFDKFKQVRYVKRV